MHAKSHKEENTTHVVAKTTWNTENRKRALGLMGTHHPDKNK
jgi:hypothetical protein